ncbi:MAG: hypothetical protein WCB85_08425 [Candidatus Dormiibacterota bacterium]
MTIDTLGMIRRGWQDGAATVAPQVPGLADLLEKRLGEAVRLGTLDESSLLAIVDAATQLAANAGAVDIAPALSKRLRRHVYEYLLSLDATGDDRTASTAPERSESNEASLRNGSDELAALGRHQLAQPPYPFEPEAPAQAGSDPQPSTQPGSPPPRFSFHIGDPDDLLTSVPRPGERDSSSSAAVPELFVPADLQPPGDGGQGARRASFADPSSWPKPIAPQLRGARIPPPAALSDDGPAAAPAPPSGGSTGPGAGLPASEPRFQEMVWPLAAPRDLTTTHHLADGGPSEDGGLTPETLSVPAGAPDQVVQPGAAPTQGSATEARSDPSMGEHEARPGPSLEVSRGDQWTALSTPVPEPPAMPAPTDGQLGAGWPNPPSPAAESGPGWALRQPESVELHLAPGAGTEPRLSPSDDQVPEKDLVQLRAGVDEKLRRKRCDDAAALLQQAAQELGGEAVAELALDAGDRCRTLGKRNAALNCYLAASRADPVYEAPLARLADICIDDQDIDLAVSYLERIARLTRLRGDQRGALRIYRKIATIAPYRDDVLEMLMRAQTTGRIDA